MSGYFRLPPEMATKHPCQKSGVSPYFVPPGPISTKILRFFADQIGAESTDEGSPRLSTPEWQSMSRQVHFQSKRETLCLNEDLGLQAQENQTCASEE